MQSTSLLARALLCAALAGGCVSAYFEPSSTTGDMTLLRRTEQDGVTTTWRLHTLRPGSPALERTERREREVASLGMRPAALSRARAESVDLQPFGGVFAEGVTKGKAAYNAGLRAGDVLVAVDGVALTSPEQLEDLVLNDLAPGTSATLDVRRAQKDGEIEALQLVCEVGARQIEDTETQSTPLRGSRVVRDLLGLEAAELGIDTLRELELDTRLGEDSGGFEVHVAGVGIGTPAYLAGLRRGDRIVSVDGVPLRGLDPLVGAVLARADERGLSFASDERVNVGTARAASGPLQLAVEGPLGAYVARVDVERDLFERTEVDIPILFEYSSDTESRRWSFLDFIFQFGANSRSRYLTSSTRAPARHTYLSMLPFGCFEIERKPEKVRYQVLWFIEWERRR